ncbi:Transposable element tcb1 transposase [Caligus rogercresseyi]|uniref:Transposable element tcb1 transposase n=1 Tax=Caligus rogercresseyi TaxID=217165 RepID=A0A7T8HLJ6_CALRO|nr:Transposable element tcb1 transposase [Caligus rogercresseyi]
MFWSKEIWPPSSPDSNLLNYYVWGVLEKGIQQVISHQRCLAEGLHCGGSGKNEKGAPCQRLHEVPVQAGGGHRG